MRESSEPFNRSLLWLISFVCLIAMTPAWAATPAGVDQTRSHWWKGNLHTHSFWSDGDHFSDAGEVLFGKRLPDEFVRF